MSSMDLLHGSSRVKAVRELNSELKENLGEARISVFNVSKTIHTHIYIYIYMYTYVCIYICM